MAKNRHPRKPTTPVRMPRKTSFSSPKLGWAQKWMRVTPDLKQALNRLKTGV